MEPIYYDPMDAGEAEPRDFHRQKRWLKRRVDPIPPGRRAQTAGYVRGGQPGQATGIAPRLQQPGPTPGRQIDWAGMIGQISCR